ncbi:MAG: hypothetical protein IKZ96_01975 [Bacilli bacterium]|nr:hypothetical protein [Bacilli bacterium]
MENIKEHNNEIKQTPECVIRDGLNEVTFKYGNDNDLYIVMDYCDKYDENKEKKREIEYDGEFSLKLEVGSIEYPDLYSLFVSLFNNLKADRMRYGSVEKDSIEVYSNQASAEVANYIVISCSPKSVVLDFKTQKPRPGYVSDINSSFYIPIKLNRTWSTTNIFEEFFKQLPEIIALENSKTKPNTGETPDGPKSLVYINKDLQ